MRSEKQDVMGHVVVVLGEELENQPRQPRSRPTPTDHPAHAHYTRLFKELARVLEPHVAISWEESEKTSPLSNIRDGFAFLLRRPSLFALRSIVLEVAEAVALRFSKTYVQHLVRRYSEDVAESFLQDWVDALLTWSDVRPATLDLTDLLLPQETDPENERQRLITNHLLRPYGGGIQLSSAILLFSLRWILRPLLARNGVLEIYPGVHISSRGDAFLCRIDGE